MRSIRTLLFYFLGTWMTLVSGVHAQVEITWQLVHDIVAQMEPIYAVVQIANYSGITLDLTANGNARLSFDIEERPTSTLGTNGYPLLRRPILIPNGEVRDVPVDLMDGYSVVRAQPYSITPRLQTTSKVYVGERRSLDVQPGMETFRRVYGTPSGDSLTVSLRVLHREGSDRLFFRLDSERRNQSLASVDLGRFVRLYTPRLEQDATGTFHVLHQMAPGRFLHSTFSRSGEPERMTYYSGVGNAIRLTHDEEEGIWLVTGGTPFTEDPENPGYLVAPAPPSPLTGTEIGTFPVKGKTDKSTKQNKKTTKGK